MTAGTAGLGGDADAGASFGDALGGRDMSGRVSVLPGPPVASVSLEGQRHVPEVGGTAGGPWQRAVAYSNCRAAICDGKPEMMQAISQGRKLSLDVLTAPPLERPLCWASRRTGFGVEPT